MQGHVCVRARACVNGAKRRERVCVPDLLVGGFEWRLDRPYRISADIYYILYTTSALSAK